MKRKTMALVLSSLMLVMAALTGCSSSNKDSSESAGGSDKQVTLNVWGMGEEAKSLPKIAEDFEKENPNIKIKVQALPWDTAHDKLLTAVASKQGPDVLQLGTTWVPEFGSAKALMDIAPMLDQYPELKPDNFYPGSINTTKFDGATVGVPWYVDTRVLYYRTDILQSVGYNEAPKTWDELKDAAAKLKARGGDKYGISLDTKEQSLAFMFARQNGSKLLDGNKPLFNEAPFVEAVDYLNGFFKEELAPIDLGMDIIPAFRDDAITPMFISGPWMVKIINDQAPELDGKWATAVLPKKENNISALGGSNLTVFQYTKHKDEAMKFLAYMSKPETQLKWMELTNSLPAAKEAWNSDVLENNKNYKVFGDQMEHSEPMPMIKPYEALSQKFLSTFEQIYRANANVQDEMNKYNKEAEDILNNK
jgi:multiple sugar transport system substrate-binding protein